ncbi:uncharacterized protein LOC9657732 [Selaginella moellendorffii]|nr:uncharacterized protein LOC9657732 [Selaginella moellendorffii]|eukprot:XP_002974326.2 uncharacterized protein LOC9657732 [Selaginella moellendorffii]
MGRSDQAGKPVRYFRMHHHQQQQHGRRSCCHGLKLWRIVWSIQVLLAMLVVTVMATSLVRLYFMGFFGKDHAHFFNRPWSTLGGDTQHIDRQGMVVGSPQLDSLVSSVSSLQGKVGKAMESIQESMTTGQGEKSPEWQEQSRLLLDVAVALDQAKSLLMQLKITGCVQQSTAASKVQDNKTSNLESSSFGVEEINKYLLPREHRLEPGKKNFMGGNATFPSVGLACATSMKAELEQYMDYDVGDYCPDDWTLGQKLLVHGCDPLPRRRCLARAPQLYQKPLAANESLWRIPDSRNVRWNNYKCKNFECLAGNKPKNGTSNSSSSKGFYKCSECFDLLGYEKWRWVTVNLSTSTAADFRISDVLALKPAGEIRIGVDFSVGTGTFAARMKEHNVTIISATLNLGAPFNEMIALRGLVPLYLSVNQRLPFFDNTLDILHTTLFLDGWIDHILLDYILFDWDRVLRPGGLLWIDRFFCPKQDIDDYLYFFLQLHYKKHLWVVTPKLDKDGKELFFSAVLEKPPRPF